MKPKQLPFLDGIRGLAILAVFLFHALGTSFGFDALKWDGLFRDFSVNPFFLALYPLTYGSAGVAIFFVISGFCIHLSYAGGSDNSWVGFFNRRFWRIYPPYLLAVLVFFFVFPWDFFSKDSVSDSVQLGTHLLAVHNLDSRTFAGINGSFWSIAVELQLYAIYPLLLLAVNKWGWRRGLAVVGALEASICVVGAIAGSFYQTSLPRLVTASPFAFWLSWSIGAYLAQRHIDGRPTKLAKVRFDLVLLVFVAFPLFKPTAGFSFLAAALLAGVAIDRLISGRWTVPNNGAITRMAWNHFGALGVVSFSFYLIHQPLITCTRRILLSVFPGLWVHPILTFSICCAFWYPLIFLASKLMYARVEQPSIALGKAVWNRRKTTAGGLVVAQSPLQQ